MRAVLPLILLIAALPWLGFFAHAQAVSAPASATAKEGTPPTQANLPQAPVEEPDDPDAQIPAVKLDFKPEKVAVPGSHGSSAFVSPIVCSPAGTPLVSFIEPSDFGPQTIYSLDPKGGHAFSVKSVPDLFDIGFIHGYFASDSLVGLLVNATKDDTKASNTISMGPGMPPRYVYPGEHLDYLVEFDSSGNYKATVELPKAYSFRRLAALPDDTLLALAYDHATSAPRLLRLDSDGQVKGSLQIPEKMMSSPELVAGESGDPINQLGAEGSLSWWIFAPTRQRVLLYQAHSKSPVLEVGAGGAVREVPIQSPKGYVLDGVISANDRWIMRFRKENLSDSVQIDPGPEAKNYVLYEVDSGDGSLRRRIDLATGPFYSIACEEDGVFTAFSVDGEKVNLQTADLPR